MKFTTSLMITLILVPVLLGVVFGILTDSRNSILIKEMFYVGGAAVIAALSGAFLLAGREGAFERLKPASLLALAVLAAYMVLRHLTGIGSVNGPFTISMFMSLAVMTAASLPWLRRRHMMVFLAVMVISSVLLYAYAVLQWQGIHLFRWDAGLTRTGRSTGSLGNPNLLGGFASAFLPLGVVRILTLKRGTFHLRLGLSAGFALLSVLAIIASGTRGSLIGLAAGAVLMAVFYLKHSGAGTGKIFLTAAAALLLIGAASIPMASRLSELSAETEDQGTLQVRKVIWSGALSVFAMNPLAGNGPGSFQILFPAHRNPYYSLLGVSHNTLHAHCEYLEILTDLGIIGLLLWGVLAFFTARGAFRGGFDPVRLAAAAGVAAMLAEALVSVHLRWPPTAWLFATLVMIALASPASWRKPGRWSVPAALALFLCSGALVFSLFAHYLPSARSSELVFRGKDLYLARTETALNNAYSAAIQWNSTGDDAALGTAMNAWSFAAVSADSAVHFSLMATETYPGDLGAWYALGSAYLTRHMVNDPPVAALKSALDYTGMTPPPAPEGVPTDLELGMEAYDSLTSMAPDYAEVHNNLALGYSNMGMVDQALDELYRAYQIHGHRRGDYYYQAMALYPLSSGENSGPELMYHMSVEMIPDDDERVDKVSGWLESNIACIFASSSTPLDSLKRVYSNITMEVLQGPVRERLTTFIEGFSMERDHPFGDWLDGSAEQAGPAERMPMLRRMNTTASVAGGVYQSVLPEDSGFYAAPAECFMESGFSDELLEDLLHGLAMQIALDQKLDETYTLSYSSRFFGKIDEGVISHLNAVRTSLGGSRAAMRSGAELPWLPGSAPALLSDTLRTLQAEDSLNIRWYKLEMQLDFMFLTSYWWGENLFTSSQNNYLLDRVFFCRDRLRELSPDSWQYICASLMDKVAEVTVWWCDETPSTVQLLRDDLVSGAERRVN